MRVMNEQECALVNDNLSLVGQAIRYDITVRPDIPGMEYDDLYQVGSLALCRAAQCFDGRCRFPAFARVVIRNALIDHCRKTLAHRPPALSLDAAFGEEETCCLANLCPDLHTPAVLAERRELRHALAAAKRRYRGVTLKGIEAMELKTKGYTCREIGELYGVRSNVVAAWISRARTRLLQDTALAEYQSA